MDVGIFPSSTENKRPPCFYNKGPNSTCLLTQELRGGHLKPADPRGHRETEEGGRTLRTGRQQVSQTGECHSRLESRGSQASAGSMHRPHSLRGCSLETGSQCGNGGQSPIPRAGGWWPLKGQLQVSQGHVLSVTSSAATPAFNGEHCLLVSCAPGIMVRPPCSALSPCRTRHTLPLSSSSFW